MANYPDLKLYVAGGWRQADGPPVINPADESVLGTVPHATRADQEQDRKLDSSWDWLRLKRDEIRQVLGFFIGEEPVDPFDQSPTSTAPAAALATGPP